MMPYLGTVKMFLVTRTVKSFGAYADEIEREGFVVLEDFLWAEHISQLRDAIANIRLEGASQRAGKAFGLEIF